MVTTAAPKTSKHPHLTGSQLALVIVQVRFPSVFRIADKEFVAPFQEAIRTPYPVVGEQHEVEMVIGPKGVQQLPGQKQWRFQSESGDWAVSLSDTALTLEARAYADFEDFLSRFTSILASLHSTVAPTSVERLGLRYINEFRQPEGTSATGWKGLIDSAFLGPLDAELGKRYSPVRTIQDLTLGQGSDELISLKHGFIPNGTTVQSFPGPGGTPPASLASGAFYLLDIDHFRTRREPFEVSAIRASLERFHVAIYDLFRLAVTEKLYLRLEPDNG